MNHAQEESARTEHAAKFVLAAAKAARTGKWATIMTRVGISVASKARKRWAVIGFLGPGGRESRGVVDLIAIRRNHAIQKGFERGDLFEIILIQVKGGKARWPTDDDVRRLGAVKRYYGAKAVLVAQWQKGKGAQFFKLDVRSGASSPSLARHPVDPAVVFR